MNQVHIKKWMVLACLLAIALCCAACGSDGTEQNENQAVAVAASAARYEQVVSSLQLSGAMEGLSTVNIMPTVIGEVSSVYAEVGQKVTKGQKLFTMKTTELQLQLQQAEAGLAVAEANYQDALRTYQRTEALYKEGAVSKQQYEQAALYLESADPASTRAAVQLLRTQIGNATVKAPIDGTLAALNVRVGEYASQMQPAAVVVDMDRVVLQTSVTEQQINALSVGQAVDVTVTSAAEAPFTGSITEVAPAANAQSRLYPIKIVVENPDHVIKPGMFAEATVTLGVRENVLLVPKTALVEAGEGYIVYVCADGVAHAVDVTVGAETETDVEIVSGISEGDLVVTTGQYRLTDGTAVQITEAK